MAKLRVHVQPGAKREGLVGFQDGVLRLKLSVPPIEGRANKALVELLAKLLDVPKSRVTIVSGHSARDKIVELIGLTDDEARERLAAHIDVH